MNMSKGRLEAFSDGILAIIITIMVLSLSAPEGGSWSDLSDLIPTFLGYLISYVYIGIYWFNHHRLIVSAKKISGLTLWTNLLWMFCVSLIPFAISWISKAGFGGAPGLLYSITLFVSAIAYHLLVLAVYRANGRKASLFGVLCGERRSRITIIGYAAAMPLSYYYPIVSYVLYIIIALLWIFADIENKGEDSEEKK
ncbi:MAG: TMEM175 family protein [Anaerovoracaceae bacterium]|jgi:uncharacterized membrane protein